MNRRGSDPHRHVVSTRVAARRMVRDDLISRGVTDRRVLAAMVHVPREQFVPAIARADAYGDHALPIGEGQTISQPFMVAWMTQQANLNRHSRVLEIGTGTGYHTAVLATIAEHVYSIERIETLHHRARRHLEALQISNVTLMVGDGALGYPEAAPFDAILVAAAVSRIPEPLESQLAIGGRLVIPVGGDELQQLTVLERVDAGNFRRHGRGSCRFVPFVSPELG